MEPDSSVWSAPNPGITAQAADLIHDGASHLVTTVSAACFLQHTSYGLI